MPDSDDLCYYTAGIAPTGCPSNMVDRHVYWVHGYGGSGSSWTRAGNFVSGEYQVFSVFPDYSEHQQNLENESKSLKQQILMI
ncbi:MAG: hypothetical protein R2771_09315 [Saprospiraceae bacterium]